MTSIDRITQGPVRKHKLHRFSCNIQSNTLVTHALEDFKGKHGKHRGHTAIIPVGVVAILRAWEQSRAGIRIQELSEGKGLRTRDLIPQGS